MMLQNLTLTPIVKLHAWLRGGEQGQTLAEYGLIMALISVFVITGAGVLLQEQINAAFTNAAGCFDGAC